MTVQKFAHRMFQLWEYNVSHGSLLIRSPRNEELKTNVDIICTGVEYVELPRFLRGLEIIEPQADEVGRLAGVLGKYVLPASIHILASGGRRFAIVAASFNVDENKHDIFDSPFE
jgi:hypothetical protein